LSWTVAQVTAFLKTGNSIQSNIIKCKLFKISKSIWIFYTLCCIFKLSDLHKMHWKFFNGCVDCL